MSPFVINKHSWRRAVELAVEAGRIYGERQRVYKDDVFGWTWGAAA